MDHPKTNVIVLIKINNIEMKVAAGARVQKLWPLSFTGERHTRNRLISKSFVKLYLRRQHLIT